MFDQFRNKFPVDDLKWIEYKSYFQRLEVPAKTILLEEGEISKKLFIIEKGSIRVWFNNNGKDLTTQFFFENQSVSSIESFMKKLPSPVVIETIEPSVLWWIQKSDLDKIVEKIKEIPELRDRFINMLFERTFDYIKHFVSFKRLSYSALSQLNSGKTSGGTARATTLYCFLSWCKHGSLKSHQKSITS